MYQVLCALVCKMIYKPTCHWMEPQQTGRFYKEKAKKNGKAWLACKPFHLGHLLKHVNSKKHCYNKIASCIRSYYAILTNFEAIYLLS